MNPITAFEPRKAVPALPAADLEIAKDFARASKATATRRAYQKDFARFTAWCDQRRIPPIPAAPETVAAFLAAEAARGIKPATIGRRVAAIRYAHKLAGYDDPPTTRHPPHDGQRPGAQDPRHSRQGGRHGGLGRRRHEGGLRDRAILLLGFAGAFRRSELVALDVTDLEFCDGGIRVHIRRSKTDQEGAGDTIAIVADSVACPVKAVRAWLEASNITTGPLFRPIGKGGRIGTDRLADHTVVRVVKASARRVGLDSSLFAGHSLRSGFLTSAAGRGASIFKMMDVSRHKSMDTLRGYVRDAELFRDHAGAGLL